MSKTEYFNFCQKLAFHAAPTLLGIKCASLVSLSASELDLDFHSAYFNRRASSKGLKSKILCCCGNRKLMLVYSEEKLAKRLSDNGVQKVLRAAYRILLLRFQNRQLFRTMFFTYFRMIQLMQRKICRNG